MGITVNLRKQGGAAVMTIPVDVLRELGAEIGSAVELEVTAGTLTVRPAQPRRRYTLTELLKGVTPAAIKKLNRETAWFREGQAVGRELE